MSTSITRESPAPDADFVVDIVDRETDSTIKALGPYSGRRQAEKAEIGVSQQLNHERYYTQIRPVNN